jgi:DNA primase
VAERSGVFVDYGQNTRDRTIACAYSIRPTPDARASAPLRWDEVPRVEPARFTLPTMRKRLDAVGDLTAGMWRRKVSLIPRFEQVGLDPADPDKLDSGRRRGRVQRWESDQRGQSRRR